MKNFLKKYSGFTLAEMLLVLAIASGLIGMFVGYSIQKADQMKRERVSMQIQQILNASLAYYLSAGQWPTAISDLQNNGFLPSITIKNPYGQTYSLATSAANASNSILYVYTTVQTSLDAYIITGTLPLAYATDDTSTPPQPDTSACTLGSTTLCNTVVAGVNIPGQNLNNARSVNFGALYHSGACVPAPSCPPTMIPEILVVPAGVSGVYTDPQGGPPTAIPVSSFTAFALGTGGFGGSGTPINCTASGSCKITSCDNTNSAELCTWGKPPFQAGNYWRVCLSIATENGTISVNNNNGDDKYWGSSTGSVLAITRCVPADGSGTPTEPSGSDFTVWNY